MGKITVVIPDEMEEELRKRAFEKTKGKRGGLSQIVQEAIKMWLEKYASV